MRYEEVLVGNENKITLPDLAVGLRMDRANLRKLIKKLELVPHQVRGKRNRWTYAFDDEQIEAILAYREGIEHDLIKTKKGYKIKSK